MESLHLLPRKMNLNTSTLKYILVRLLDFKYKKKNLKATWQKGKTIYNSKISTLASHFSSTI